jgi:hypothetical protein
MKKFKNLQQKVFVNYYHNWLMKYYVANNIEND